MALDDTPKNPFSIKDCALVAISTGKNAQNLKELYDNLLTIYPESIYYHFWGELLRPKFGDAEFNNDFSHWCHHGLNDTRLAERLGVVDPTDFKDLEALRKELVDVIEERLDEAEHIPWSKKDKKFYFLRSQIVVFSTQHMVDQPEQLAEIVPNLSVSTIFYHFIDARRRTASGFDDFSEWLGGFDKKYSDLRGALSEIDPYFSTLPELRKELSLLFNDYFRQDK